MKILFISPDIEEKSRGINVILKTMVKSAKELGHNVGLLTGYPHGNTFDDDELIETKIEHLHLQHYLREGRQSFRYMVKGGYRRLNILKALIKMSIFRTKQFKVERDYLSGNAGWINNVDFVIKAPYYYQFLTRNYTRLPRFVLRRITKKYKIDLVVVASPSLIRSKDCSGAKLAHFVHDTMPFELVEAPPDENTPTRYAKQFYSTCTNSDIIFTNSKDTKSKVLQVNKDMSTHVLYGTASSKRSEVVGSPILQTKNLKAKRYLLFISTVEKRKNIETLMEAYSMIAQRLDMPLVIVGSPGYGAEDVFAEYDALSGFARDRILFTGYVTESEKYSLLENAYAFVFPSVYEGMGLILVEAMVSGIPVITSSAGALKEVGQDSVLYIDDPYDPSNIADKIMQLYNDPKLYNRLAKNGLKTGDKFSHSSFTKRLDRALKVLEK